MNCTSKSLTFGVQFRDLLFYIFICFKTQIKNSGAKIRKVLFAESLVDMATGVFYENVRNEEIHVYTLLLNTHKT